MAETFQMQLCNITSAVINWLVTPVGGEPILLDQDSKQYGSIEVPFAERYLIASGNVSQESNDPSVLAAEAAIVGIGGTPERAVINGGVDANWLVARGIATVTLGCGQLNQHMTTEALDVNAFQKACRVALRLATATER